MEIINLKSESKSNRNFLNRTFEPIDCTCLNCRACLTCIVFAPIVGIFLAPTLGVTLTLARK